jgi:hypothetical protein
MATNTDQTPAEETITPYCDFDPMSNHWTCTVPRENPYHWHEYDSSED